MRVRAGRDREWIEAASERWRAPNLAGVGVVFYMLLELYVVGKKVEDLALLNDK